MDAKNALEAIRQLAGNLRLRDSQRQISDEAAFEETREGFGKLCDDFAQDPTDPLFLATGNVLAHRFMSLVDSALSTVTANRARVNAALAAGRVRRSHFAAYLAGKYSADTIVGPPFKCWLHNTAAWSAIDLREAILSANPGEHDNTGLLSVFANSATQDAIAFLSYAEEVCGNSPLTQFNNAVLNIFSASDEARQLGVHQMLSIEGPNRNVSSTPELVWHQNNYHNYTQKPWLIFERVRRVDGNAAEVIKKKLEEYKCEATTIENVRKNNNCLWESEDKRNRQLIAAATFGAATTGGLGALLHFGVDFENVRLVIAYLGEFIGAAVPSYTGEPSAFVGDGGIASASMGDGGIASASMGDGGIAGAGPLDPSGIGSKFARVTFGDLGIA